MTLAHFTTPTLILPRLEVTSATDAIRELSAALEREHRIGSAEPFARAALDRELLLDTDTGVGVAFPHVRVKGLRELSVAVGRIDTPFRWSETSSCPVRLVFLLVVPAEDVSRSLELVSGLARLSLDEDLVARFHAASDAASILERLRAVPVRECRPGAGPG